MNKKNIIITIIVGIIFLIIGFVSCYIIFGNKKCEIQSESNTNYEINNKEQESLLEKEYEIPNYWTTPSQTIDNEIDEKVYNNEEAFFATFKYENVGDNKVKVIFDKKSIEDGNNGKITLLINENEYIIYNEPVEGIYKDFWNWFGSIRIKEFNENILLIKDIENTYCRIYGKSSITFLDKNAKEQFKIENIISNALFVDEPDRYAYINLPIQVNQDSIIYYRENEDKEIDEKYLVEEIEFKNGEEKVIDSFYAYTNVNMH